MNLFVLFSAFGQDAVLVVLVVGVGAVLASSKGVKNPQGIRSTMSWWLMVLVVLVLLVVVAPRIVISKQL